MLDMAQISKRNNNELDENSTDLSPTEFIAEKYFPLKDYELIKIYDYHFKIIDELNNLIKIMEGNKEEKIDQSEEYIKLKKRADEYGIRFSRHHLYPFKREIENIKMFLEINKSLKKGTKEILRKKLTTAYQNALQGLQSYISYRSAQNLSVNHKLKEMLLLILNYNDISKNLLIPIQKSVGGDLELLPEKCNKIIEIIDNEFKEQKYTKKIKRIKKKCKELNIATNLSMYEPKLGDWTMKSQALARLRFGQILKARNSKKIGVKKSQSTFSDRNIKSVLSAKGPKGRVDEVVNTDDIQTEIENFHLHTCQTKENIPMKKHISETNLKTCANTKVSKKEKQLIRKSDSCDKNVGFFHFISDVDDNNEKEMLKSYDDLKLVKHKNESLLTFPFLPLPNERKKLTTLIISNNVIKDLSLMMNSQYLKPNLENEESWNIISRISDSILDIIIGDILEEVFDDDCIDALYENELKSKKDIENNAWKLI